MQPEASLGWSCRRISSHTRAQVAPHPATDRPTCGTFLPNASLCETDGRETMQTEGGQETPCCSVCRCAWNRKEVGAGVCYSGSGQPSVRKQPWLLCLHCIRHSGQPQAPRAKLQLLHGHSGDDWVAPGLAADALAFCLRMYVPKAYHSQMLLPTHFSRYFTRSPGSKNCWSGGLSGSTTSSALCAVAVCTACMHVQSLSTPFGMCLGHAPGLTAWPDNTCCLNTEAARG